MNRSKLADDAKLTGEKKVWPRVSRSQCVLLHVCATQLYDVTFGTEGMGPICKK